MAPTLTGTLNMLTATIDWRDETARCVGVFRSENAAALEVEYKVHLDRAILDLLARAFLKAGVPVLRGSEAELPNVRLLGDTLSEIRPAPPRPPAPAPSPDDGGLPSYAAPALPPVQAFKMDGQPKDRAPKVDRRSTWREERKAAAQQAVLGSPNGDGHGNGDGEQP